MSVRDLIILGTSSQQPTRKRNHGAYLLRWNNEGLLFDPGEGTQRQFIFANVAPTVVSRMFISHFHGDHCLGAGSMIMRLNLDKIDHTLHCYYPGSGKKNFAALRRGCVYHEVIDVKEHPVKKEGLVEESPPFKIECAYLDHGTPNLGWKITEPDRIKFDKEKLKANGVRGEAVRELEHEGRIKVGAKWVCLEDVSWVKKGDSFAYIVDTRYCEAAIDLAKDASLLLTESTYLEDRKDLAKKYMHMTAKEAATIAKKAGAKKLILTHFSARYSENQDFEDEAKAVFPESYAAEDLARFNF